MEAESDLTGSVLAGRYRILERLGVGAMGAVYLGEHLKIGRKDAIKVLHDSLATDREAIARFNRGARNVAAIRHPNICTIYDYSDTDDGFQFVAMEYVPGETLGDLLLREGRLPLGRAIQITRQIAAALQAAHDVGIVHRDLKPANIMVTTGRRGEDEVKVVDFDIAKGPADAIGEEVTRLGFVIGTPEYMSPEQLIGEKLDGRSDVYSLALVFFRMVTGVLPFQGEAQEVMVKRLTDDPMRLADAVPEMGFPPELDDAIRRALRRRPGERQESAEAFAVEVTGAVGGAAPAGGPLQRPQAAGGQVRAEAPPPREQPPVPPTTLHSKPTVGGHASRRTVLAAVGGGLVLVAAVATLLLRSADEPATGTQLVRSPVTETELIDPGAFTNIGETPLLEEDPTSDPPANPLTVPAVEQTTPTPPASGQPSGGSVGGLDRSSAGDLLVRLLDRLGPPEPAPPVLRAIQDSARIVDEWPGASNAQRARSAYVMASALLSLGDTIRAVELLERAVDMEPGNRGYNTLLNAIPPQYRSRGR